MHQLVLAAIDTSDTSGRFSSIWKARLRRTPVAGIALTATANSGFERCGVGFSTWGRGQKTGRMSDMRTVIVAPDGLERSNLIEALRYRGHEATCFEMLPSADQWDRLEEADLWIVGFPPTSVEHFSHFRQACEPESLEPVFIGHVAELNDQHADLLLGAGIDDVLAHGTPADELAARIAVWECRVRRRQSRTRRGRPSSKSVPVDEIGELRAIYEGAIVGILVAETTTRRIVAANPAACRMFGYEEAELRRLKVDDLHPAETVRQTVREFEKMAKDGTSRALVTEVPCRRKDGDVFYADISPHAVTAKENENGHLVGFFHDVTEQRAANLALARSETRFRAIFEGAALGIAVAGKDGRITECNQTFAEMLGYRVAELVGSHIGDLTHPEDWDQELQRVEQFKGGSFIATQLEKRYLHKKGHVVWGRLNLSFVPGPERPQQVMGVVENITAHKIAERALRESEERFANFVEASAYGYVELDVQGYVQFANDRVLDIFGYRRESVIGHHFGRFLDERDQQRVAAALQASLHEPIKSPREYTGLAADGRPVYAEIYALPMRVDGEVVGFQCTVLDITERVVARNRLAESESRYRLIADNVTDVIWTGRIERGPKNMGSFGAEDLLRRWRFTFFSPSVERLLGYCVEEALRLRAWEIVTPESYRHAEEHLAKRVEELTGADSEQEPQLNLELEFIRADGQTRWCEVTASILVDEAGNVDGAIAVARDITTRHQAEQALRESESTLRNLIENMPDQLIVVDREAKIEYVNRSASGMSPKDMVARSGFSFIAPAFQNECREALERARNQRVTERCEALDIFGRWWDCRIAPIVEEGRVAKFLIICNDITERKQSEREVEHKQQLLRELLDLFERDREVLAFELHDGFAQQLTGAMLNFEAFEALQQSDTERARESYRRAVQLLRESIAESRRLVGGLRPPVLDEFGIVPAIDHLVEQNRQEDGPRIELLADLKVQRLAHPLETAVFRILQEMLTNARRHSQSDRIRVELRDSDCRLQIAVEDWGVGFDPEQVKEGHFGLKGVQERARLLGGSASIESSPGNGTRIEIELPLLADEGDMSQTPGDDE